MSWISGSKSSSQSISSGSNWLTEGGRCGQVVSWCQSEPLTGMFAFHAGGEDAMNSSIADVSSSSKPCIARVSAIPGTRRTIFDDPFVITNQLVRYFDLVVPLFLQ